MKLPSVSQRSWFLEFAIKTFDPVGQTHQTHIFPHLMAHPSCRKVSDLFGRHLSSCPAQIGFDDAEHVDERDHGVVANHTPLIKKNSFVAVLRRSQPIWVRRSFAPTGCCEPNGKRSPTGSRGAKSRGGAQQRGRGRYGPSTGLEGIKLRAKSSPEQPRRPENS